MSTNWRIDYSRDVEKFIKRQDIHVEVKGRIKKVFHENEGYGYKYLSKETRRRMGGLLQDKEGENKNNF